MSTENQNIEDEGRELGWEETITEDGKEFTILPDGDYEALVVDFTRERHQGSEKLPPCNKAIVVFQIKSPQGNATIRHQLFLHSRTEGMISAFFVGIGQKKHGEPLKMNWSKVIGAKAKVKIGTKLYNDKQYNEIKKFYDPAPKLPSAGFTPGNF